MSIASCAGGALRKINPVELRRSPRDALGLSSGSAATVGDLSVLLAF